MTLVDDKVSKRAIFEQEIRSIVETRTVMSPVSTKLITQAKNVYSPFTGVTPAKNHQADCIVPVGTQSTNLNELAIDRNVSNAIEDCKDELSYAKFDVIGSWRRDLMAGMLLKLNTNAVTDFVADATPVAAAEDLSTSALVRRFLIKLKADHDVGVVGLKQKIDGGRTVRCEHHGMPFVAAGPEAFVQIVDGMAQVLQQVTTRGMFDGNFVMSPYGVAIINLGNAATNSKQLIYGVGGVPTMAYREDNIDVDMGEMVTKETAAAADLDIGAGDRLIQRTWYMSATIKTKNHIFPDVQQHVSAGLMA